MPPNSTFFASESMIEETVTLEFNRQMGSDIWLMGFRSEVLASRAKPGQFLMIRTEGISRDPLLRRPFSVHGIGEASAILILYRIVGRATSLLSLARENEHISVIGPLGKGFRLPGPKERAILVAGGMGLAPMYFLAQSLPLEVRRNTKLLLGFSTSQEDVLIDRIKDLGLELSLATEDGSMGFRGTVADLFEQVSDRDADEKSIIYACGPNPMLKKIVQETRRLNLTCYVSLEGYMACGLGICLGCAIKAARNQDTEYYYACKDGPVFSADMIDWEVL
jgi:dihydroorotate dehydrogenase electron transfer subunit